ncbi:MAG: glycoside hydrolase family 95 protein, partial [Tannerella sp.]|nr:glycoside hydrolase family 95 protein [Tannerella sp.]
MKKLFLFIFCVTTATCFAQNDAILWYAQPANVWMEALPVGNSRLGAMIYGNPAREELQLNEET